jgi:hypothetical protein
MTEEMQAQETMEGKEGFSAFVEHQRNAINEAGKALLSLIPNNFKEHGQSAFNELIEAYRALFNATVDEITNAVKRVRPDGSVAEEAQEVKPD